MRRVHGWPRLRILALANRLCEHRNEDRDEIKHPPAVLEKTSLVDEGLLPRHTPQVDHVSVISECWCYQQLVLSIAAGAINGSSKGTEDGPVAGRNSAAALPDGHLEVEKGLLAMWQGL